MKNRYKQAYQIWKEEDQPALWYAILVYLGLVHNIRFDIICQRLGA